MPELMRRLAFIAGVSVSCAAPGVTGAATIADTGPAPFAGPAGVSLALPVAAAGEANTWRVDVHGARLDYASVQFEGEYRLSWWERLPPEGDAPGEYFLSGNEYPLAFSCDSARGCDRSDFLDSFDHVMGGVTFTQKLPAAYVFDDCAAGPPTGGAAPGITDCAGGFRDEALELFLALAPEEGEIPVVIASLAATGPADLTRRPAGEVAVLPLSGSAGFLLTALGLIVVARRAGRGPHR